MLKPTRIHSVISTTEANAAGPLDCHGTPGRPMDCRIWSKTPTVSL